jgi:sulfite reductase beta subunit
VTGAVKNIIETWAENARKHERMGEWIDRIGWERFFDLTAIPFTLQLIDDFTLATETFRSTPTFKW